ncbi:MAG: hypothetical protein OQK74_00155 [Gammaproteobacteria bacterium]|nr:hypothetical protein [Gammaproteobacteria bacterium]
MHARHKRFVGRTRISELLFLPDAPYQRVQGTEIVSEQLLELVDVRLDVNANGVPSQILLYRPISELSITLDRVVCAIQVIPVTLVLRQQLPGDDGDAAFDQTPGFEKRALSGSFSSSVKKVSCAGFVI